jgi:hypothetical protein
MYDIEKIREEINLLPEYKFQISLQTVEGCDDPFYGTGAIVDPKEYPTYQDAQKAASILEKEFIHPMFPELEYINSILSELKMYRTRMMRLIPGKCYNYHQDSTKRMHIPVYTNEDCFLIIDDVVHRYPANGSNYEVNTLLKHTAVNAGREERIHIVGCI